MPFYHAVHRGTIAGGGTWSVGFTFAAPTGDPSPAALAAAAQAHYNLFLADVWTPNRKPVNASYLAYTGCSLYERTSPVGPATAVGAYDATASPGSSTTPVPAQIALVATLESGLSGRHFRGRVYLPHTGGGTDNTGKIAAADATACATAVAAYLTAANGTSIDGGQLTAIVASAEAPPIVAVSVDTVLDTQRRRRDKITGSRQRHSV